MAENKVNSRPDNLLHEHIDNGIVTSHSHGRGNIPHGHHGSRYFGVTKGMTGKVTQDKQEPKNILTGIDHTQLQLSLLEFAGGFFGSPGKVKTPREKGEWLDQHINEIDALYQPRLAALQQRVEELEEAGNDAIKDIKSFKELITAQADKLAILEAENARLRDVNTKLVDQIADDIAKEIILEERLEALESQLKPRTNKCSAYATVLVRLSLPKRARKGRNEI